MTHRRVSFLVVAIAVLAFAMPLYAQSNNWKDSNTKSFQTTGNVGIGTNNPLSLLTLYPTTTGINFKLYEYTYFGSLYSSWRTVLGGNVKAAESTLDRMEYAVTHATYGGIALLMAPNIGFEFHTAPGPSTAGNVFSSQRMLLDLNGNLGIGTPSPTSKLHVAGNAFVSGTLTGGNIAATYQDVAEWVPSNHDLAPGTVVVLDLAKDNTVLASHAAYDTAVAGVVSAQPGLTLGVAGKDKEMIATTGRVKINATAINGPIRIGDLLVTSSKPGQAMRSTPINVGGATIHRPGTIIGKALEALPDGEGQILILLSMQ